MKKEAEIMDQDMAFYSAIDMLKTMILIPSVSRQEKELAETLEYRLKDLGLKPEKIGNNLILGLDEVDKSKPTILLNSHIDTVKPSDSWSRDPFGAEEDDDGKIFGLGSNDAGASVVSLLHTYILLKQKPQPYNLIFMASAEEEVSGMNGAFLALQSLPEISFAVIGEPTGMHPAIAEKGLMVIDGVAYGKSGHAARNEGINAIYEAITHIEKIKNFSFPQKSPLLGEVKTSVTQINAGTQHNVIPDKCTFVVDVRTNECYSNKEAFEILTIESGCQEMTEEIENNPLLHKGCFLKVRSLRLNSSSIDDTHPFVKRAVMIGKESFGSPTLSDQALMNFPTVKIGPGNSSRSHTADEFIYRDEIREAIEIYFKLLDNLTI